MNKRKVLSDKQLIERLISMGLMKDENTVNERIMSMFAEVHAGLYIWEFKSSAVFKKDELFSMQETFADLAKEQDYQGMYLLLSLRYDQIMKPLPDPVWWLMCSPEAIEGFMRHFVEHFSSSITREFEMEELN